MRGLELDDLGAAVAGGEADVVAGDLVAWDGEQFLEGLLGGGLRGVEDGRFDDGAVEAAIVAAGGKYGVARSIDDAEKLLREWGLI